MILSDRDIKRAIDRRDLGITPYDPAAVQPSSIDLRLGSQFTELFPPEPPPDLTDPADLWVTHPEAIADPHLGVLPATRTTELGPPELEGSFTIPPGLAVVLGHTLETVRLPDDLCAIVEGLSTLGRCGLGVHVTAGFIDSGFAGEITLELTNQVGWPIRLRPGMRIAQLVVMRLSSPAERPYGHHDLGSKYQGQRGAVPARPARSTP